MALKVSKNLSLLNEQNLFYRYFWRVGSQQLANEKLRHHTRRNLFIKYHIAIKSNFGGGKRIDPGSR